MYRKWRQFWQFLLCLRKTNDISLIFTGGHLKICQSGQLCQRSPEKIPQETAVAERDGELVRQHKTIVSSADNRTRVKYCLKRVMLL